MKEKFPITESDLQDIERYLNDLMTPEEHLAFDNKLEEEEGLRDAVKEYKTLIRGVETAALKVKMQDFHAALPVKNFQGSSEESKRKRKKRISFLSLAAASFLGVIILASGWWFINRTSENEKLFATYFTPDPGLVTPMSSTDNYIFYEAMVDYKQNNYSKAIDKWESLLNNKPENDTLNYFLGVAYLANKEAENAIPYLRKTTVLEEGTFKNDAYFYLGLAYLKRDNISEAIKSFEKSTIEESNEIVKQLKE